MTDPGYDLAPVPVRITDPEYPAAARERGVRGTVLVEFVIDISGRVGSARVVRSVPGLDAAAIDCVRSWLFKPALRAGKAVETTARAPVKF
jgi:protein TonB